MGWEAACGLQVSNFHLPYAWVCRPEAHRWKGLEIWTFDLLIPQSVQSSDTQVDNDQDLQQGGGENTEGSSSTSELAPAKSNAKSPHFFFSPCNCTYTLSIF